MTREDMRQHNFAVGVFDRNATLETVADLIRMASETLAGGDCEPHQHESAICLLEMGMRALLLELEYDKTQRQQRQISSTNPDNLAA